MSSDRTPISVDPVTGIKSFDTRAPRTEVDTTTIARPPHDGIELPVVEEAVAFDEVQRERYREFAAVRSESGRFLAIDDPRVNDTSGVDTGERVEREALRDECEMVVVGGGFGGLLLWYKLRACGIRDVRFCEAGGDVGGTWYWNRYPGITCDVESYSYLPLLDETGYFPTMKYASGDEILRYCYAIAEQFGFYERCLFHTRVEGATWSEGEQRWVVRTDRGDEMRARFVVLAHGSLTTPQLARIDGMETFEGEWFHSARWRHDIDLHGKTVGIIGTGATAVQLVPELAHVVGDLFVFQRTPSTVDIRNQRATTAEEIERWSAQPGWSRARRRRFQQITDGRTALQSHEDFLAGRVDDFKERKQHAGTISRAELLDKQLESNFRVMEELRALIDEIVEDEPTAERLKPYHTYGCKRPTLHDEYLAAFNLGNVHLVDVSPHGVTQINARGVVHGGEEYPLDVIVFATGYKFLEASLFETVVGAGRRSITERWTETGTATFLGIHTHEFPNLFIIGGPQGGPGGGFNYTFRAEAQCDYVADLLATMRERGVVSVDVTADAEHSYVEHCRTADLASAHLRDCASYYNHYGDSRPGELNYYGGNAWFGIAERALETLDPYEFASEPGV